MVDEFERGESASASIRRRALEQVQRGLERIVGGQSDRDDAVHAARQTFKVLRALLALERDMIGEDVYTQETRRFRAAGRRLAVARDSAVAVETFDRLARSGAARRVDGSCALTRRLLVRAKRVAVNRDLRREHGLNAAAELVAGARARIVALTPELESFTPLACGLTHSYRVGQRGLARVVREPEVHSFHEWRKEVKRLWHQLELLGPAGSEALSAYASELRLLSDTLNDSHDLASLRACVLEPGFGAPECETTALVALIDGRRRDLEREALDLGRRLFSMVPGEFAMWTEYQWGTERQDGRHARERFSPLAVTDDGAKAPTRRRRLRTNPQNDTFVAN